MKTCITVPYKALKCQQVRRAALILSLLAGTSAAMAQAEQETETAQNPPQTAVEAEETIVWIDVAGKDVPAIHNSKNNKKVILLLHDLVSSAVDPSFIQPLREILPEKDWDVLALRLPSTTAQADGAQYRKLLLAQLGRTRAALGFLQEFGYERIAIAGHGFGAFTALQISRQEHEAGREPAFFALVIINTLWYEFPEGTDKVIFGIENSSVPVLDIAAVQADPQVKKTNEVRKAAAKVLAARLDNNYSRQLILPLHRQNMQGAEEIVARVITNWLRPQQAPQQ